MLAAPILKRMTPGTLMGIGLALATIGFLLLTQVTAHTGIGLLVTALLCYSLGFAPVVTLATDLIVGSAPPERAGAASAISETGAEFGGAMGIAILGSVGTAMYRTRMSETIPAGIPAGAATAAKETLGGAVAEAGRLPDDVGANLLGMAHDAFILGLELAATSSAVIVAILAIIAFVKLRRIQPGAH
jgi:DHA2 family multidrug resistance protein-like MFS transporter